MIIHNTEYRKDASHGSDVAVAVPGGVKAAQETQVDEPDEPDEPEPSEDKDEEEAEEECSNTTDDIANIEAQTDFNFDAFQKMMMSRHGWDAKRVQEYYHTRLEKAARYFGEMVNEDFPDVPDEAPKNPQKAKPLVMAMMRRKARERKTQRMTPMVMPMMRRRARERKTQRTKPMVIPMMRRRARERKTQRAKPMVIAMMRSRVRKTQ